MRTPKQIAEDYYINGKIPSNVERSILKKSKYAHLLKPEHDTDNFSRVFESRLEGGDGYEVEKPYNYNPKNRRYTRSNASLCTNLLRQLAHELEEKFNLGIENHGKKFHSVNIDHLKSYIKSFIENHPEMKEVTKKDLYESLENHTRPARLMADIYSMCL